MAPELGLGNSLSAEPVSRSMLMNAYSVDFDGVDDYVDTAFRPDFIHTNATLSFWANMDNFTGGQVFGCHNGKRFYCGFAAGGVAMMGVQNVFKYSVDITGPAADGTAGIETGTWVHIALVAEGGTATYYANGAFRDSMTYTQSSDSNPDKDFLIGAVNNASIGSYMEGLLDEVAIFDSALSAAQIKSIYNGGKPQSLASYNPVAWWRMGDNDGGTGSTITDQGSGGNNGTLTNGPVFSTVTP